MIDKILIERKLGNIEEFLKELDAAPVGSLEEFKSNVVARRSKGRGRDGKRKNSDPEGGVGGAGPANQLISLPA